MTKNGDAYWRDEDGQLWLAESFIDAKGAASTTNTAVDEVD